MLKSFSMKKNAAGFTLVELLVVIAIIGLLASIVLVSLGPARQKSRDARRQSDIRQINLAMEMCYDDAACGGPDRYIATTAGATVTAIGTYMPTVPKDPVNIFPNQYTWTLNASPWRYYCVYTKLEAEANTWVCASNKGVLKKTLSGYTPSNADCCGFNVTL